VVGAANDRVFSLKETEMTARAYGAQMKIMANISHNMMLASDRRKVADYIIGWLENNDP